MNADNNNNQHADEHEQLATTTEQAQAAQQQQQQQQAIIFLKKMILVLEKMETFPLQTRNKTDELVADFLENLEDDQQQQLLLLLQRQQQAVVLLRKITMALEQKETCPLQTRNKTDELVVEFLEELGDDVHEMLCGSNADPNSDNYRGLDSDRDTEAEVEAIVRFFPEVLTRRMLVVEEDDEDDDEHGSLHYPIQLLAFARDEGGIYGCNVKAVSFIPVVARLAIEFGCFEEEERGGLLCEDRYEDNVLHCLTLSGQNIVDYQDEQCKAADDKYLQVLIQLRKLGLLRKEDIQSFSLLHRLCREDYFEYLAEKRCRFLVEWDPTALLHTIGTGWLPLHHVPICNSTLRGFKHLLGASICYYPRKYGISLLFKKTKYDGYTPFRSACMKFGHEKVMEVVEDTLAHCYFSSDNTTPLNIEEALLSAAIDENTHLDCVYFLLRREPDILQKLLSSSPLSPSSITTNSTETIVTEFNPKKRKRKDTKKNDHDGT